MANGYEDVANAALALPPEARAMLAEDLVASLESSQEEIDEGWRIQIERRVKEIKEGKVQLIPGEQVMNEPLQKQSGLPPAQNRRTSGGPLKRETPPGPQAVKHNARNDL